MMKMEVRSGKGSLTTLITGVFLILLALLSAFHSKYWLLLVMYVGIGHIVSSIIGFCLIEKALHKLFKMPVIGKDEHSSARRT